MTAKEGLEKIYQKHFSEEFTDTILDAALGKDLIAFVEGYAGMQRRQAEHPAPQPMNNDTHPLIQKINAIVDALGFGSQFQLKPALEMAVEEWFENEGKPTASPQPPAGEWREEAKSVARSKYSYMISGYTNENIQNERIAKGKRDAFLAGAEWMQAQLQATASPSLPEPINPTADENK